MNFLVMLGMMGLMLIFFHGRGHHRPSPEPNQGAVKPVTATQPSPEAPRTPSRSGEPGSTKSRPGPTGTPEAETTSPSTASSAAPTE